MDKIRAIKTVSLLWVGSILGAGCAFLTQVLLARELGPEVFGVFSAALATVVLVGPLASFGIGGFWLKSFGQEGWQAVRWLRGSFLYTFLTMVMGLAALLIWAIFGPHNDSTRMVLGALSAYLLGQVAIELVSAKLQLEARYLALTLWQFLPHLLRLVLISFLAFLAVKLMTLSNVAYAYSLISIGVFSIGSVLLWRMFNGQLTLAGHTKASQTNALQAPLLNMREVARHSWPFGLASVFHLIYFQSDIILLKYITGDEAAGVYNVDFVIMAAVYLLPSVIYQKFLMPKIHRWANHDRPRFYQVYRTGNWVMLGLGLSAMLTIWLLAPLAVPFLFGEAYREAIFPLSILALAAPARFVATSVGSTLVTQEHMRLKIYFMGATALLNVCLNLYFIPSYGVLGAAIATVVSEFFLLFIYFLGARVVFSKGDF